MGALFALGLLVPGAADEVSFNRDIRPILSDRCLACHGADEAALEGDLRLDDPASAFAERDGSAAIVPGDPEASGVIRRIHSADPDWVMPPPRHPLQLEVEEKELLERWIKEGAEYEGHWAFQWVERPSVSKGKRGAQAIDAFVEAQRAAAGWWSFGKSEQDRELQFMLFEHLDLPDEVRRKIYRTNA